jgi:hypothetical protein
LVMQMRTTISLVVLITVIIGGCSTLVHEETPIVYIDREPALTANLFARAYRNVSADEKGGGPLTFGRARELLDDVIVADVLVREAEAAGYADEEDFVKKMDSFSERELNSALDEWSRGQVEVTDDEIRLMYEINLKQRTYSVIYGPRRDRIEEALAKLDAGEAFADVAAEYSTDPAAAETGGGSEIPLPYKGDVFTGGLYALETPGDVTPVLTNEFRTVFVLLRFDEETPAEPVALEEMEAEYERSILFRKAGDFLNAELDSYIAANGPYLNDVVYDAFFTVPFRELGEKYSGKEETLVSAAGRDVLFDEVYEALSTYLHMSGEEMDGYKKECPEYFGETLDAVIQVLLRNKLRTVYARAISLDQTPEFRLDYYRRKGDILVSEYYERVFVPTVFDPTEEELEAYYRGHKTLFGKPERMKAAYVAAYDEEKVRAWRDMVASGGDFETEVYDKWRDYMGEMTKEEIAARNPKDSVNTGTYIYRDPDQKPITISVSSEISDLLEREAFKYGVGETSPVIAMEDGRYLFFQNVDYFPYADKPFEKVKDEVRLEFQNEVLGNPETDEMLVEWFNGLVEKHEIEINESVFKALYKQLSAEERGNE